ncbi:MAG: hypothetical protein J6X18_08945 [Bacteroidales bacterium]|nr:hypothetical protein [Bacteroidales bacterium]
MKIWIATDKHGTKAYKKEPVRTIDRDGDKIWEGEMDYGIMALLPYPNIKQTIDDEPYRLNISIESCETTQQ